MLKNHFKKRVYFLIYFLCHLLLIPSTKAQPAAKDICGLYKIASDTEIKTPLLQLTYIKDNMYWMYYRGFLQTVKPVLKGSVWELVPLNGNENHIKLTYTDTQIVVHQNNISITYKKIKLPQAAVSLFDPKTKRQQLYQISSNGNNQKVLANDYFSITTDFRLISNTDTTNCNASLFMSLEDPIINAENQAVGIIFRGRIDEGKEFSTCKGPDYTKIYTVTNREVDGFLCFNKKGDLQALAIIGYMAGALFVNKNYTINDSGQLVDNIMEVYDREKRSILNLEAE